MNVEITIFCMTQQFCVNLTQELVSFGEIVSIYDYFDFSENLDSPKCADVSS